VIKGRQESFSEGNVRTENFSLGKSQVIMDFFSISISFRNRNWKIG
jgi:hypothetical protein